MYVYEIYINKYIHISHRIDVRIKWIIDVKAF